MEARSGFHNPAVTGLAGRRHVRLEKCGERVWMPRNKK